MIKNNQTSILTALSCFFNITLARVAPVRGDVWLWSGIEQERELSSCLGLNIAFLNFE